MIWRQTLISIVPGLGMGVVAISITSGWERVGNGAGAVSVAQSLCLFLAGIAIASLGTLVRQLVAQLSTLEKELSDLRWSLKIRRKPAEVLP